MLCACTAFGSRTRHLKTCRKYKRFVYIIYVCVCVCVCVGMLYTYDVYVMRMYIVSVTRGLCAEFALSVFGRYLHSCSVRPRAEQ